MTVRVFRSTDTSAPVLTNALGSLIGILDACLVNGYGSGGSAKAPAGWTKPYASTNKGVYLPAAGTRLPMRVDHSAATYYARVYGAESFSTVDAGLALFPLAAQVSGGLTWQLTTNTAANRPWVLVADERTMYLFVNVDAGTPGAWVGHMFGDFFSYRAGDAYNSMVIGAVVQSTSISTACRLPDVGVATGHYCARGYAQTGGSVNFLTATDNYAYTDIYGRSFGNSNSNPAYPNPVNNEFVLSQALVSETVVRGRFRGLWGSIFQSALLKSNSVARGDTVPGAGLLAGRTFEVVYLSDYNGNASSSAAGACMLIETSNTWDTN